MTPEQQQPKEYIITEDQLRRFERDRFHCRDVVFAIRSCPHPAPLHSTSIVDAAQAAGEASNRSFDSGYALGLQHGARKAREDVLDAITIWLKSKAPGMRRDKAKWYKSICAYLESLRQSSEREQKRPTWCDMDCLSCREEIYVNCGIRLHPEKFDLREYAGREREQGGDSG